MNAIWYGSGDRSVTSGPLPFAFFHHRRPFTAKAGQLQADRILIKMAPKWPKTAFNGQMIQASRAGFHGVYSNLALDNSGIKEKTLLLLFFEIGRKMPVSGFQDAELIPDSADQVQKNEFRLRADLYIASELRGIRVGFCIDGMLSYIEFR